MKHFIAIILMGGFSVLGYSQNLRVDKVDEFTGNVVKVTESVKAGTRGTNRLYISVRRVNDSYALELWSSIDQGCGGASGNYTILLSSDGRNIKYSSDILDVDCSDTASSLYVMNIEELKNFDVSKIRFAQSDTYDDFSYQCKYTFQELIKAVQ
jgi:hypothetical protein